MDIKRSELDIFDLISERHYWGRNLIQEKWNEQNEIQLSISEWFMLHLLSRQISTAAEISKQLEITRQATHKLINKLENLGLVYSYFPENNKRMKFVRLTDFGEECYNKNKALKAKLENKIKEMIGEEQFNQLIETLATDWMLAEEESD